MIYTPITSEPLTLTHCWCEQWNFSKYSWRLQLLLIWYNKLSMVLFHILIIIFFSSLFTVRLWFYVQWFASDKDFYWSITRVLIWPFANLLPGITHNCTARFVKENNHQIRKKSPKFRRCRTTRADKPIYQPPYIHPLGYERDINKRIFSSRRFTTVDTEEN